MAKTLEQLLGYATQTGIINAPEGGVPEFVLPSEFLSLTEDVDGDTAQWDIVPASRRTATASAYGSPSRRVDRSSVSRRTSKMIHTIESVHHGVEILQSLRGLNTDARQTRAQEIIDRQTTEFRRRFNNLRVSAVFSALRHGKIYFDGNGNLLPTSSGAVTTVDLQVPANNKDQLNSVISASWATAGTSILTHLTNLQTTAIQTSGMPIRYAMYGSGVISSLLGNTEIGSKLLASNTPLQQSLLSGMIPDNFGMDGVKWIPAYPAFFADQDGTNQTWFPSDYVIFLPEITRDWYALQQGSYEVPTSLGGISADANAALSDFAHVYGMFSYAQITTDPAGVKHICGDTFLPVFKNPEALYIADTQF